MQEVFRNFTANRDIKDYIQIIEKMGFSYVRTDEYVSQCDEARNKDIDSIYELKMLLYNIIDELNQEKGSKEG